MKPHTITLLDGRKAVLEPFQAADFVRASQGADASSPTSVTAQLISRLISWENSHLITQDQVLDLYEEDFDNLGGMFNFEVKDGKLPSGATFEGLRAKVRDIVEIEKVPSDARAYERVSRLCLIDGKPIDRHDVAIMRGDDFIAALSALSGTPR